MKYTIKQFKAQFPTDEACMAHIFKQRYPDGYKCPKCGKDSFHPVNKRRSYACSCGFQIYPTEGTIFHKSSTSLVSWFYAIFLMSQSKNGVSAKELERHLGVTYKTAWRMAQQIRKLMSDDSGPFDGEVEADETYVGGIRKGKRGRGASGKTPVFGVVKRQGGIKTSIVKDVRQATLLPLIEKMVKKGSIVFTDESNSSNKVESCGYGHDKVKHGKGQFSKGNTHTNTIEGFWSQFKRSVNGTFHAVSPKYLQSYLNEFSFRYGNRSFSLPSLMFSRVGLLSQLA